MSVSGGMKTLTAMRLVKTIGGIATHVLLCRYFGSEGYGVLAIALAALGLIRVLDLNTSDALQTLLPVYLAEGQGRQARRVTWFAYACNSGIAVAGSVCLVAMGKEIAGWFDEPRLEPALFGLVLWNLLPVLRGPIDPDVLLGLRWYRSLFWFRTLETVGSIVAVAATWWTGGSQGDYFQWLFFLSAPTVLYSLLLLPRVWNVLQGGEDRGRPVIRFLRLAGPLSLGQSLYRIYANAGAPFVGMMSVSAAGLYRFALTIADMTTDFMSTIAQVYHPLLAEARMKGNQAVARLYREAMEVTLTFAVPALWGLVVWAELVAFLLGRGEFAGSVPLIQLLSLQVLCRVASQPAYRTLLVLERSIAAMIINGIKVSAEILIAFVLVTHLDVYGMVWAHVLAAMLAVALLCGFTRMALGSGAGGVGRTLGMAAVFLAGYALLARSEGLLLGSPWVDRVFLTIVLLIHGGYLVTRGTRGRSSQRRIRSEILRSVPFLCLRPAASGAPLISICSRGCTEKTETEYVRLLDDLEHRGLSTLSVASGGGACRVYRRLRLEKGMVHVAVVNGEWRSLWLLIVVRATGMRPILVTVFSGVGGKGRGGRVWERMIRLLSESVRVPSLGKVDAGVSVVADLQRFDPFGWGARPLSNGSGIQRNDEFLDTEPHASCAS